MYVYASERKGLGGSFLHTLTTLFRSLRTGPPLPLRGTFVGWPIIFIHPFIFLALSLVILLLAVFTS